MAAGESSGGTRHSGSARVRLDLLDGFRLRHDGAPVVIPRGLQRVIALVGLRPGATRAELGGLLWPDSPDERALSRLRTALWRLRRSAYCPVVTVGDTVRLDPAVELDVDELVRTADGVRDGVAPRQAAVVLAAGRHDLLPGWYDDWVLVERERLRQLRLHALEEIARTQLRAGQHGEALQAALEAMRAEPLRETPHRLIVQVHLAEGNAYEALHAFYVYRDLIMRDLQLEPSPTMCALLDHILSPLGQPRPAGAGSHPPVIPGGRRPPDRTAAVADRPGGPGAGTGPGGPVD
ncbi:AfsR/SARP family transcriptional regulator [Micromonospora echinofusca]|uniref:Transcriptional regulator n=1 Tax=Micromonospora echinofusca TaxID=47858 RepID=A0ABS3VRU2_MICEH|nr:BTAD domain-containing putative transcriptional regulator [Micromonospora echinofusca]MBO4207230.1 transcriptional regulator [Micromonospora echinofusca]